MNALLAWLESRTGYKQLLHESLHENIPYGARFRYVTGSMLVCAFVTQMLTGVALWMAYSPSSQTAWESVYYIQHEMTGGWLLRGVHHFMAQAMMVLLGLHLLQVIVDGAYRAPREINYWLGIILLKLTLALGLTGYLLPWDQKGYWATNVATNLMTLTPFVGQELQQLVLGGSDYGHHTLTRFFALHAGVLPLLMLVFLGLHVALFRKHGITAHKTEGRPDDTFWPKQVLYDAIACLVLMGVVLLCVIHFDVGGLLAGNLPESSRGAELGAPADPAEQYSAARPEWYFLFLFQLLKYFHNEFVGAILIPGAIMAILILAPLTARARFGHAFNVVFLLLLLGGAAALTGVALWEDAGKPEFAAAKQQAHHDYQRTVELINARVKQPDGTLSPPRMIPKRGAVELLRNDPLTQGPRLFERHCASCHEYLDPQGKSPVRFGRYQEPKTQEGGQTVARDSQGQVVYEPHGQGAPNLFGFGSRQWILGLLDPEQIAKFEYAKPEEVTDPALKDKPDHPARHRRRVVAPYFGDTAHKEGDMAEYIINGDGASLTAEERAAIAAALSAQASLPAQAAADAQDGELIAQGLELLKDEGKCGQCHTLGKHGNEAATDLTGYASYEWLMGFVGQPTHRRFYGKSNDRMPDFAADLNDPTNNTLSIRELSLIVDWLRGDYYQPGPDARWPREADEAWHAAKVSRLTDAERQRVIGDKPAK